jgi:hypothetical protein
VWAGRGRAGGGERERERKREREREGEKGKEKRDKGAEHGNNEFWSRWVPQKVYRQHGWHHHAILAVQTHSKTQTKEEELWQENMSMF